jgi:hypothetical protein
MGEGLSEEGGKVFLGGGVGAAEDFDLSVDFSDVAEAGDDFLAEVAAFSEVEAIVFVPGGFLGEVGLIEIDAPLWDAVFDA